MKYFSAVKTDLKNTIKHFSGNIFKEGIIILILLFLIISPKNSHGQWVSNLRTKYISIKSDTILFDTLSTIPKSLYITLANGNVVDTLSYSISFENARLVWNKKSDAYKSIKEDSLKMTYRVFPYMLSQSYQHKDVRKLAKDIYGNVNPFYYSGNNGNADLFQFQGLNKTGSISRGVTFGNNQDLVVNSNLNLQLAGKLGDDIEILASITDQNIPIQPEGNTQQIQDFDKVFIQLSKGKTKLIAGDFELKRPNSYFMNFYKKGQGGLFSSEFFVEDSTNNKNAGIMRVGASAAISKGQYAKNTIAGVEGNQGPYKLTGANNELYIIILSGSEKVFIDGALMQRGQDNDYVIDYNTGEITFMPKRLITKDSRISIEFQYSNNNYARSMLFANTEFEKGKYKIRFNAYSEQDSKNQPLQQNLSPGQQQFLSGIGNNINNAVWPAIDTITYDSTQVLYKQIDTTVLSVIYHKIFVYSTSPDSAIYRLGFSIVGQGNGDYVQINSSANGKVYQWVAPINGVRQGNSDPIILLVTPKKRQLFTLAGDYAFTKNTKLNIETALSNNDVNLFSTFGKKQDVGDALKIGFDNNIHLGKDSVGWIFKTGLNYEQTSKYFSPIERYRPVEFERDWNLGTTDITIAEDHLGDLNLSLINAKSGSINYDFKTYLKGDAYKNAMNSFGTNLIFNKFKLISNVSLLNAMGTINPSTFLREKVDLSKSFGKIAIGVEEDEENNKFKSATGDSLLTSSYRYNQWQVYIASIDTAKKKFRLDYGERYDYGTRGLDFKQSTKAQNADFNLELLKNPNSRFSLNTTYRILTILDTTLSLQKPTNSLLNRLEYSFSALKKVINSTTFYEIGTGQEQKQQYTYVKVPAGTGVYQYIGDLNNNGVQDLNEFQIAAFPDQADYIRVYTPTDIYIKDYTNRFNEALFINPALAFGNKVTGFKKFIGRFSDNVTYSSDRKTLDDNLKSLFNPFQNNVDDSVLVSTNASARNSIYFNKTSSQWGLDYTISDVRNKSLLSNGFDSRIATDQTINSRWNVTRFIGLNLSVKKGNKQSASQFFTTNDYNFNFKEIDPKISYQPGVSFRASLTYTYSDKINNPALGGEKAIENNIGTELKYSLPSKGTLTAKFNYVQFNYNAAENTTIAFAMLEGLHNGQNLTWGINLQRNLSQNMQLSLNYDGRKSETTNVINTGSVQVRAYF